MPVTRLPLRTAATTRPLLTPILGESRIGFDVMSGVALAAGGFIVTASVYVFRLERFHAVVRPAVLTAFLGYLAVAVGLLFTSVYPGTSGT